MAGFISYRIEGPTPDRVMEALMNPREAQLANRRTLEELGNQVKTAGSSEVRARYSIKKQDLDPNIRFSKPSLNNLKAEIEVKGKPIDLMYFGAKQVTAQNRLITRTSGRQLKRASRLGAGVTYQVLKSEGPKNQRNWFIQWNPRLGKLMVFYRKDKDRHSMRSANVVTVASMFSTPEVQGKIDALVQAKAPEIWRRNFLYYLSRSGR